MTNGSALRPVAQAALEASGMDSVGLYPIASDGGVGEGVILGMPDAFVRAYETAGMPIDPVLAAVRGTGRPASTETCLGQRWTACPLYLRVSGRFGLRGFATFPLYEGAQLSGVLYFGASSHAAADRLGAEGLLDLSVFATQTATGMAGLPRLLPRLSPRQRAVAEAAAEGLSNSEIARALDTGEAAVRKHLKALNRAFGTTNRTAMAAAFRRGL